MPRPERRESRREYPPLLQDLAVQVTAAVLDYLPAELASRIGVQAAEHVRRHWGGQVVYIPAGRQLRQASRNAAILAALGEGADVDALAVHHGVTARRIRQILAAAQKPT